MMNIKETLKFLPIVHKTSLVPLLLGHTGIGKTEVVEQYARSIGYNLIVIHVAQLEPSDFVGLYKTTDDGRTTNCPPSWLPYVAKLGDKKAKITEHEGAKGYVVFLDEVNRGHEDIRQAMYQFLTTKKIHTYEAPENTVLIAAANPSSSYETYEFDAALVNRYANIKFRPQVDETLNYLEGKHGDSLVLTWLNSDKGLVELGDDDFEISDLRLTPRIAENTIKIFREIEGESPVFQRKCLETIIPKDKVASFISFLDEIKHINYVDVINGVKKEKINDLLKNNRRDILSTIVTDLGKYLKEFELGKTQVKTTVKGCKVSEKDAIINMANFLEAVPAELTTVFLNLLGDTFEKKTCILNDKDFCKPLTEKLRVFKAVLTKK